MTDNNAVPANQTMTRDQFRALLSALGEASKKAQKDPVPTGIEEDKENRRSLAERVGRTWHNVGNVYARVSMALSGSPDADKDSADAALLTQEEFLRTAQEMGATDAELVTLKYAFDVAWKNPMSRAGGGRRPSGHLPL